MESENLNDIESKSNIKNEQKLNNNAIYQNNDVLDGRNQVVHNQYKTQQIQQQSFPTSSQYQKDHSPIDYVTANHSESSRERIMNHKMTGKYPIYTHIFTQNDFIHFNKNCMEENLNENIRKIKKDLMKLFQ